MTSKFNPFDKEISKLEASDLAILREVYEGWFVDYKQEIIQAKDLAKQIAAFANSNGGWLFIGIKEKDGKERTASEFSGVTDIDKALVTVRNAASVHIHPQFTGYTCKVIKGPNDEIGLEEDRAIIVIEIKAGLEPPYIHSSGQIYRRFDDESRPEKDRLELDKLYAKSEKFNENFIDYYTKPTTLKYPELPRLFLYFISDPRETFTEEKILINFDEFRDVMKGHKVDIAVSSRMRDDKISERLAVRDFNTPHSCDYRHNLHTSYDTFYGSHSGYTARQTQGSDPSVDVITFEWKMRGDAFVEIPLNIISFQDITTFIKSQWSKFNNLNSPNFDLISIINQFKQFVDMQNTLKIKAIDYTPMAVTISAATNQFLHLRQRSKIQSSPFVKAKLINTGHTIPFFDSLMYINNILSFGVPITRYDEIWCPSNKNLDSFEPINYDDNTLFRATDLIIYRMFLSIGLLNDLNDYDTFKDLCESSFATANRIDQ
jgi:hypothetical protein